MKEQNSYLMDFIENMINEKGSNPDIDEKERLFEELDKKISNAILLSLSGSRLNILRNAVNHGASEERIEEIIRGSGVNFDGVISRVLSSFRISYLKVEV